MYNKYTMYGKLKINNCDGVILKIYLDLKT